VSCSEKEASSDLVQVNVPRSGEGLSRRAAMQWVMAAVAASAAPATSMAQQPAPPVTPLQPTQGTPPTPTPPGHPEAAKGYGTDPSMVEIHQPGDLWPLTFTAAQRKTAKALADVILPKDELGPAASAVGVVEMVDEWVSAPYPAQQADRPIIIDGLAWMETESTKRFGKLFGDVSEEQKRAICDDICFHGTAKAEFKKAAAFFSRFRSLCAGAYYGTPEGWQAIGYVGNVPLQSFDGPPPEVLQKLGVVQTVK